MANELDSFSNNLKLGLLSYTRERLKAKFSEVEHTQPLPVCSFLEPLEQLKEQAQREKLSALATLYDAIKNEIDNLVDQTFSNLTQSPIASLNLDFYLNEAEVRSENKNLVHRLWEKLLNELDQLFKNVERFTVSNNFKISILGAADRLKNLLLLPGDEIEIGGESRSGAYNYYKYFYDKDLVKPEFINFGKRSVCDIFNEIASSDFFTKIKELRWEDCRLLVQFLKRGESTEAVKWLSKRLKNIAGEYRQDLENVMGALLEALKSALQQEDEPLGLLSYMIGNRKLLEISCFRALANNGFLVLPDFGVQRVGQIDLLIIDNNVGVAGEVTLTREENLKELEEKAKKTRSVIEKLNNKAGLKILKQPLFFCRGIDGAAEPIISFEQLNSPFAFKRAWYEFRLQTEE